MKTDLVITGVGMMTAVGLDAPTTLHSIRSGISRLAAQPIPDRIRNWVVGGRIPITVPWGREKRLAQLAQLAAQEAWRRAFPDQTSGRRPLSVILGGPEIIRPGYRFPIPGLDVAGWAREAGIAVSGPIEQVGAGACSAQVALTRAAAVLSSGRAEACLVGAVDTQLQLRVIRWHEDHYRLKCGYMNDGLMPGEAASFLVLEREAAALARGAPILARLAAVATSEEAATILSDQPNTAAGLTSAARTALAESRVASEDVSMIWCDQNGESYRAREWAFAEIRLRFQDHTELMHPADCFGDLGAAGDATLLGLAAMSQVTGWAQGRPVLVFSGSEAGIRAATVVLPPAKDVPPILRVSQYIPQVLRTDLEVAALGPDEVDPQQSDDPARVSFEWELRQEHLNELASIYTQRKSILQSDSISWHLASEPEQRLLNHVDAVIAGGPTSTWAVASGLLTPDEGTCFGAALVLASIPTPANLEHFDRVLSDPSKTNLNGIDQALRHAPSHPVTAAKLRSWLRHGHPQVRAMATFLAGYRREAGEADILPLLKDPALEVTEAAITALRRIRAPSATAMLTTVLNGPSQFHDAALQALFYLDPIAAAERARLAIHHKEPATPIAAIVLAKCGDLADVDVLLPMLQAPAMRSGVVSALGILGNVGAVPALVGLLETSHDALKLQVSEALNLMLGAGLRETASVIERTDLLWGEYAEQRREIDRALTNPDLWSAWWRTHQREFDPTVRWRRGRPFSPGECISELSEPISTIEARDRAYSELVASARFDVPFEPDWFISRQRAAIADLQVRWRKTGPAAD